MFWPHPQLPVIRPLIRCDPITFSRGKQPLHGRLIAGVPVFLHHKLLTIERSLAAIRITLLPVHCSAPHPANSKQECMRSASSLVQSDESPPSAVSARGRIDVLVERP